MRRIVFLLASLGALAAPAAVPGAQSGTGDGTLVVKHGAAPVDGPNKSAVVRLTITGSVIGQVTGYGRIIIDGGVKSPPAEVTGAGAGHDSTLSDTATVWNGDADGFKFRAVGGTYTIVIFGSDVSLFAIGTNGSAVLTGTPDSTTDGTYSLNGDDPKPLKGTPTGKLVIGTPASG